VSGIAGIFRRDGEPARAPDLGRMTAAMAHRGPDAEGAWHEGQAALGHRMLWSTPESLSEKLPLTHATGLTITADARIDNREELISVLGLAGRPSLEISDSELVLLAYEKWGADCAPHLLGDFAFAIWDTRRQLMFCARDHMGVKPLYYHASGRLFAFASEIKALLELPDVPRRLNETRMAEFLLMIGEDKAITFFEDIHRLPPAHTLIVTADTVRLSQYWTLDGSTDLKLRSDEDYAEAYRSVFTEAVRCRLRSTEGVGALLSGGLDTSSIVCVSRELLEGHGNQPLPTISAVWDSVPEADERSYIQAVVRKGGIAPDFIAADQLNPLHDIDAVLAQQGEMFYAPNVFLGWELHRRAAANGLKIVLNGLHGDYAVSHGISYLAELMRRGRWPTAISEARALSSRVYGASETTRRILWYRGVLPNAPRSLARLLPGGNRQAPLPFTYALVRPDLASRVGLEERFRAVVEEHGASPRTARREQWVDLMSGTIPYNLEVADRVSAAFSVEPRYPFCDRRLIEFCMSLPGGQRLSGGWSRMIARRAMAVTLPEEVRWREGKADINPHFARALIAHERTTLEEAVNTPGLLDDYIDRPALQRTYARYLSNQSDYGAAAVVWSAVVMTKWLNQATFTNARSISEGVTT